MGPRLAGASRGIEGLLPTGVGRARFALVASLWAIVPSLLLFGVLVALGIDTLRAPPGAFHLAFAAYSVLLAPLVETALMLAVAALLVRLLPGRTLAQILWLAALAALAHQLGGGWRQVLRTLWPLLVYAACLVLWLRRSARDAFVVTAIVHAAYNAAFYAAGVLGSFVVGDG